MAAADYRVMTDATGQRIAAALEGMSDEAVKTTDIANNLTTTTGGKVLDARQGKVLKDGLDRTDNGIAIVINGNQTTHTGGVAVGEYVIVRNSTISGITDGSYKAAQAIPANTAIDSTYLEAVDGGGLNDIQQSMVKKVTITPQTSNVVMDNSLFYINSAVFGFFSIRVVNGIQANTWTKVASVNKASSTSYTQAPCVYAGNGTFGGMIQVTNTGDINVYSPNNLPVNCVVGCSIAFTSIN